MADNKNVNLYINTKGASASIKELTNDAAKLRNQIALLDPTTKEFVDRTKELNKVNARLGEVRSNINGVKGVMDNMRGGFTSFKAGLVAAFSFGAIIEAGKALVGFFLDGVKANMEFNKSLSDLRAITGVSKEDLKFFADEAKRVGPEMGKSAKDVVEAYKLIGSAKPELLSNKEALAAITKEAIILADAAGMELPAAADSLTAALNQYSASADEASRYTNALAAGAKEGASEINQEADALLKFGVSAKSMNISIEESVALIQTLADKNLKGAEAGTALRNVLAKLAAPDTLPKEALAILKAYDVDLKKLSDTTIPFSARLTELSKIQGSASAITKVFGLENKNAAQILMENKTRFQELTRSVTGTNVAYEQAAIATDNLSTDYKKFIAVVEEGQMSLSDSSDSALRDITQFATEIIKQSEPVGDAFSFIGDSLGRLFGSIGRLINMFVPFNSKASGASAILKLLASAINALFMPFQIVNTGITAVVDGLNLLLNTGKKVANFFGADFEIDPKATLSTLGTNLLEGTKDIGESYVDIWTDSNKKIVDNHTQRYAEMVKIDKETKSLNDLMASDKLKKEQETNKKLIQENEDFTKKFLESETLRLNGGGATKKDDISLEEIEKNKKISDQLIKDKEAAVKNIRKLEMDALGDTLDEKIHKTRLQAQSEIQELVGTEEQKRQQRILIYKKTNADIDKLLKEHHDHEKKEVEKLEKEKADLKDEAFRIYAEKEKAAEYAANDLKLIAAKDNQDKILQAKLERLQLDMQYELENTELTEQEKAAIRARYNQEVDTLNQQRSDNRLEADKKSIGSSLAYASQAVQVISNFQQAKFQRELNDIDTVKSHALRSLDEELNGKKISQEDYNKKKKTIEDNHNKQAAAVKKKQFEAEKTAAIIQAIINTAASIVEVAPVYPLMALNAAIGAAQIAIISSQPTPEFAEGGSTKRAMKLRTALPTVHHGGFIDQPLLATFGEVGPEYVVPNWMLGDPMVGNMVGMMETMRQSRPRQAFAEGGPTLGNIPKPEAKQDTSFNELVSEVKGLRSDIRNQNTKIEAVISFSKLEEAFDTVDEIRSESKLQ